MPSSMFCFFETFLSCATLKVADEAFVKMCHLELEKEILTFVIEMFLSF